MIRKLFSGLLILGGAIFFLRSVGRQRQRQQSLRLVRPEPGAPEFGEPKPIDEQELAEELQAEWGGKRHDKVDEASWESFPASDAPGYTR